MPVSLAVVGELTYITVSPNHLATVWNSESVFRPHVWYRLAPWLDRDNSPGTIINIGDSGTAAGRSGEALWVNPDGTVTAAITLVNNGPSTAAVGINYLAME